MDNRDRLAEWLRAEFEAEQASGFLRLKRVPDTKVIRFLDHFDSLDPAGRSSLLTILVDWASHQLAGTPPPNPAYEQFSKATSFPGRRGGYRYLDVNLLAGLAKEKEHSQLLDFFRQQQVMDLALVPAEGLAHEPSDLVPVKPAALRRRVNATLQELFAPQVTDIGSETWRYQGQLEGSDLKLDIRYSGRMGRPQLSYNAEVRGLGRVLGPPGLCFESVLGVGFGHWDYLTVENAERSLALLAELTSWLARLPSRLP